MPSSFNIGCSLFPAGKARFHHAPHENSSEGAASIRDFVAFASLLGEQPFHDALDFSGHSWQKLRPTVAGRKRSFIRQLRKESPCPPNRKYSTLNQALTTRPRATSSRWCPARRNGPTPTPRARKSIAWPTSS